jgi:hypothetical protein
MDGTVEHKAFAPGYGEFRAQAKDELVTVALALPLDAAGGGPPGGLAGLVPGARSVALGAEQAALDLRLRHRPPAEVDLTRLDLWARRLLADAAAKDRGAVAGDVATLQVLWDRAGHAADPAAAGGVAAALAALRRTIDSGRPSAAAAAVPALRDALGRVGA